MTRIYSTGEVCNKPGDPDPTKCYKLDPGMENKHSIPFVHREMSSDQCNIYLIQSTITLRSSLFTFFLVYRSHSRNYVYLAESIAYCCILFEMKKR